MFQFIKKIRFVLSGILLFSAMSLSAQNASDSLGLKDAIQQVLNNYPSIKQAEIAMQISDAKIDLLKTVHLPDVDVTANYTRIGPVPVINFPPIGEFKMAPENNYNAALNIRETVYDFGKTNKEIAVENQNKQISQLTVDQIKQKLSIGVVSIYYNLLYLQEAISIKDEQIRNLNAHLDYVQKKKNTGSGVELEILSTQVKLSNAQNQKTDLETMMAAQMANLNNLLGRNPGSTILVKKDLDVKSNPLLLDSMLNVAFSNREEVKIANEKIKLSDLRIQSIKYQTNPVISVFANGGFKNGYIPNLDEPKLNYAAGLALKVPIFDANRKKFSIAQAQLYAQSNQFEVELAKRSITTEIVDNQSQVLAAMTKIRQSEKQLQLAQKALDIAEINFKAGTITNLELLDANTNLSDTKLALLKSQIDYSLSLVKLRLAMGEKL